MSGHDWINQQLKPCPVCGHPVSLHQTYTGSFRVCCMNSCCCNIRHFDSKLWGKAIVTWNKYVKENQND